ncbi:mechanosensitive ion channel family protein [Pseudomonas fluorescens]|uniref:mechanosensitive ion channel family protein n=1 Tax=Pseudomonas fluorescens TaxID=294 RepID=UPI001930C81A|nr:mechanosensitive ion channel family protein [Pseudomonas fluorescens]MBD8088798.1 mechanosensitive ion channel family protein [Pseudomonas fluorescens]
MTLLADLLAFSPIDTANDWLKHYPTAYTACMCLLLLAGAWLAHTALRGVIMRGISYVLSRTLFTQNQSLPGKAIAPLANAAPAFIISAGAAFIPGLQPSFVTVLGNVCTALIILSCSLFLSGLLDLGSALYNKIPANRLRPIKGYVQVVKIVLYIITTILCISALVDKSPLILLSGLGAMAAVAMLIMQDSLASFSASMQITSGDILRIGDWIEMPQVNANGEVIDIALHSVTVKQFDHTLISIPTKLFITTPFKNNRQMYIEGGRRVKRSIFIDQTSIHHLNAEERKHLHRFALLKQYFKEKENEVAGWNNRLHDRGRDPLNTRRLTNLGTFRAYVENYLRNHPKVRQDMTLLVRQLDPTPTGIPLEIYCFSGDTAFVEFEAVQSDIFDAILAILPEFGLRVHQHPTGNDFRSLSQR